jgi:hypothetical protein
LIEVLPDTGDGVAKRGAHASRSAIANWLPDEMPLCPPRQ